MLRSYVKMGLLPLGLAMLLNGCGSDGETPLSKLYEVEVTNLSNAQPLSPVGVVLHSEASLFEVGEQASLALETLAEGGDNSQLLATGADTDSMSSPLLPGDSAVLHIEKSAEGLRLSLFSMLVNTNDAFTAVNAYDIEHLEAGQEIVFNSLVFDAGTEANSESAGTIPGPADGGEGFNAARDDTDVISLHRGVITKDDGLSSSVLSEQHRFDNPIMQVRLKRTR